MSSATEFSYITILKIGAKHRIYFLTTDLDCVTLETKMMVALQSTLSY
jgi:hypothetical protein